MRCLVRNLPTLLCVALAGAILILHGSEGEGWGWLLFLAVLLRPGLLTEDEK